MADPIVPPRMVRRWAWIVVGLALVYPAYQLWPNPLRPGPETTVVTGPLRPDGFVDYTAVLNEIYSEGVTWENNAAVFLVGAIGPKSIYRELRPAFYEELGISPLEEDGDYLRSFGQEFVADIERLQQVYDSWDFADQPWQAADHPEVAAWLAANERPLELCRLASQRSQFYLPLVTSPGGTVTGSFEFGGYELREIARALGARAMLRLGEQNFDGAIQDVETLHRLARLSSRRPTLICWLTSCAMDMTAAAGDLAIIRSGQLTAEQIRRRRQNLAALPPLPSIVDLFDRGERFISLDMSQGLLREANWLAGYVDANGWFRRYNEVCDEVVAAMRRDTLAAQRAELAAIGGRINARAPARTSFWKDLLQDNRESFADCMELAISGLALGETMLLAEVRAHLSARLTIVGYALAEYKTVHGAYPDTLEALVPALLDTIPADPFGEEPIHYVVTERGTFLLYGVGQNGQDDQGRQSGGGDDVGFGDVPE
jgi:hypothetical protein